MFARIFTLFALVFVLLSLTAIAAPIPASEESHHLEERAKTRKGKITWFTPGLGNCGEHDNSSSMMVAVPNSIYGKGQHCNKYITITANGHSVKAKIRDRCPDCPSNQLDVSPAVFKKFAKLGKGVQSVTFSLPS